MYSPVLLVIAHGSRDPRHAACASALVSRIRSERPGLRVEVGFLDFNTPSVPALLEQLADEGVREVVTLPLLLTRAYHATVDIPAILRRAPSTLRIHPAEVLGPSPLLVRTLERRLYEAGLSPADKGSTGLVLAAAGSTDVAALSAISDVARGLHRAGWGQVTPAFASSGLPRPDEAVRTLRLRGAERVAVAPYVIAPGFFLDRIAGYSQAADCLAGPLGAAPEMSRLAVLRYEEAVDRSVPRVGQAA
ncbi:sirohydrochlorin chelatase [Streptomyces sp. cmx-18-6]|uniref:sirohydrochlorin chelatase n=1 Tax=Streptomyces sp. cmx-18-6 TaxID=2790930 RepID=UPI003980B736